MRILLSVALIGLACARAPEPASRIETLSLLSLVDPDARVERRWIDLADGREPAFVTTHDFHLTFPLDSSDPGRLRGGIGFAAPGRRAEAPTRASFRAGCATGTVFEAVRNAAPSVEMEPFVVPLPRGCSVLTLEVRFEVPSEKHQRRRAVWVDPVVELEHPATSPPVEASNLLLITSDTTRRDVLGSWGGAASTPALDALAAGGIVFDNAFSVAFGTTPSHASLFSAVPAVEHGVYDNASVLDARHTTLAEALHHAGYQTAAFVGAQPVMQKLGFAQGFDLYDDLFVFDPLSGLGEYSQWERRAGVTVDRFLAWLEERSPSRPFFVWLHFFDPHQPYTAPDGEGKPSRIRAQRNLSTDAAVEMDNKVRRLYQQEVEYLDRQIGRVVAALDGSSTLVAFIADHGESFLDRGANLAYDHTSLFPDVASVPLILRLPSGAPTGRRNFLLGNLDLAPTLLDLLEVEPPSSWQGRSFRRRLSEDGAHRPHLVLEGASRFEIAVRTPEWTYREITEELRTPEIRRLLGYEPGTWRQLYDRRTDPSERMDLLAAGTVPPPAAEELVGLVAAARAQQDSAKAATVDSEAHRKALKALGYLD